MTPSIVADLRAAFSGRLLVDRAEMAPFLVDWREQWRGEALAVVQPDDAQGVAGVLRWCAASGTPVTPQGGNTGLSGGATPDASGRSVVLSLTRLNRIRSLDPLNNTLTAEAGCILLQIQAAAAEAGRLFPLSLAAEGSCTIGGNLATNAGGTGVLRYGAARDLCLGLEVVTAQGELWDGLRGLRKDNTGYDLRDLFIGSEGTLGVITAAVLELHPQPAARCAAFAAVASPAAAVELLAQAQARLGGGLTGFELMSSACLDIVLRHVPGARPPLAERSLWYVLIEVSDLLDEAGAAASLQALLEAAFAEDRITDAVVSASMAQTKALWALRENISEAQGREGKGVKHDVSVPISHIAAFVAEASDALTARFADIRLGVFGHIGDGNLHFNVLPALGDSLIAQLEPINHTVHEIVTRHGGSISAEHGLGVLRRDEAARYKSPVELRLMRAVKAALDPQGLMNPGKVLT